MKRHDSKSKKTLVEVSSDYFRPAEVELLQGDPSKAEKDLGWKRTISFKELVSLMVKYDLEMMDMAAKNDNRF